MTTTLQKKRTQTTTTQLFPLEVNCEEQSLIYIKRLTAVAISNILYLRNVFNEDCYGHRKLDSIKLRILSERSKTFGASQIVQWVKGCFDAIEKKYLKQLTLGIFTDSTKPEELIEAYTLRFSYDNSSTDLNVSFNDKQISERFDDKHQDLHRSTCHLLRSLIILTQSLDKLPNDCYLTMKLLYYDDITPEDYEPPGFVASENDSFTFKGKPISITAGEVVTPHHTLKLKIRTDNTQFEDFVPTQESVLRKDSQIESHDECTPLATDFTPKEDIESENERSKSFVNRMPSTSRQIEPEVRPGMSSSTPNKFDYHLLRARVEEAVNGSQQQTMERDSQFVRPNAVRNSEQNMRERTERTERTVISKIQDLKVQDSNSNKRKVTAIEPMDFEVSQDSVFDTVSKVDKRLKSSKTHKSIAIAQRGNIRL